MSPSAKIQSQLDTLIEQFVSAFPKLDEMADFSDIYPIVRNWPSAKRRLQRTHWRPLRVATDSAALEPLYAKLPARFLLCLSASSFLSMG